MASVRANDDHEAKFPLELPKRLIQLLTEPNEIVLDCFVGSGTTAVASVLMDRQYIGVDNYEQYVRMSRKACAKAFQERYAETAQKPFAITEIYN